MGECMNLNLILLVHRPILHHRRFMPMCQGQVARMNLSLLPQCLFLGIVVTACSPSDLDMLLTKQLLEIDLECLLHCHVSEVASCDLRLPSPCMPSRSLRAQTCKHLQCIFSDRPVRASSTVCGSDKHGRFDWCLKEPFEDDDDDGGFCDLGDAGGDLPAADLAFLGMSHLFE